VTVLLTVQTLEEEGQKILRRHPVVIMGSFPSTWKFLTRQTKNTLYHVREHGYIDLTPRMKVSNNVIKEVGFIEHRRAKRVPPF
jgi:hypothetical protein